MKDKEAESPVSAVVIRFAEPGSTIFGLELQGQITPGQLLVAGQMLMDQARLNWAMPQVLDPVAEIIARRLGVPPRDEPQIAVPGMTPMAVREILKGIK